MTELRAATDYEELAFFALSLVPVPRSADPVARAAQLPRPSWGAPVAGPFHEDRAAIAALAAAGVLTAQHLPRLFQDLAGARRVGARALAELTPSEVASPVALATIQRGDARLAELLFCDLLLAEEELARHALPSAREAVASALAPVRAAVARLARLAPSLAPTTRAGPQIVLTSALGGAGRVYREAERCCIYASLPCPTREPFEATALLVLHELAVALGPRAHRIAERAALDAVAELVQGTAFAPAFRARTQDLDLRSLASSEEARATTLTVRARLQSA